MFGTIEKAKGGKKTPSYERMKESARQRNALASVAGRDVAPLPAVKDKGRRTKGRESFERFCTTYFPSVFTLPWSDDHRTVLAKIETAVREGGLFALAMPRGSGKTSLCEAACMWALLFGFRQFVALIGSDESSALEMLESIQKELECNDLLLEDFPEVCHPIRRLEGIAHRCNGQLFEGKRTHIVWTAKELVLPTVPGSVASGGVVTVAGITGRVRGMKFKRPDGKSVRPDLVIVDDPQTDESAKSPTQTAERLRVVGGAILGLAGPGKKIAGVMPCTVIAPQDLADQILDKQKHPRWQGERTKLCYAFPTNVELWEQYERLRADGLRGGDGGRGATEFYALHRSEMDAGARVAWAERHNPDELSAVQHVMNLRADNPESFWAEYQNEPKVTSVAPDALTVDQVMAKVSGHARGVVPAEATRVVAFVDVQQNLLYWGVLAVEEGFGGSVIDYGAWPEQGRRYFAKRDARVTLKKFHKAAGEEEAIYAGLAALTKHLLGREFHKDDGSTMRVERLLVDSKWGKHTDLVFKFCRASAHAAVLMPSMGHYVGASSRPIGEWQRKKGDRVGRCWQISAARGKTGAARAVKRVIFDANWWKAFAHERLRTGLGGRASISLYGKAAEAREHQMIAEHVTAEEGVLVTAKGRSVLEFKAKPNRDNDLLDVLVGCCVAASVQGAELAEMTEKKRGPRRVVRMSELQRRAQGQAPAGGAAAAATTAPAATAAEGRKRVRLSDLQKQRRDGGGGGGGHG